MNWLERRHLRALKSELALLEEKYGKVLSEPGETTQWVTAAMKQWGPRIAELKHLIADLEDEDNESRSNA